MMHLRLGEVIYVIVSYNSAFSRILSLKGFGFVSCYDCVRTLMFSSILGDVFIFTFTLSRVKSKHFRGNVNRPLC